MKKHADSISFFVNFGKTFSIIKNRLDRNLNGVGYTEFLILYHLSQSPNGLRRIELAEKVGMTASGITRVLLPMEKIGLVKSGSPESDARVRTVQIAKGGTEKFAEAVERLEVFSEDVIPTSKHALMNSSSDFLLELGGRILMS